MKRPVELVEAAFEAAGHPLVNLRTNCFIHGGTKATTLSVFVPADGDDRDVAVKCQAEECSSEQIWRRVGLWLDTPPAPIGRKEYPVFVSGEHVANHMRVDHGTKGDKQEWWQDLAGGKRLPVPVNQLDLYGSERLNGSTSVVLAEGERATDALIAMGIPAVGTFGTGYTPSDAALAILKGRTVKVWPDADEEGERAARKVAKRLSGLAAEVMVVTTDGLPSKFDAADASPVVAKHLIAQAQPFVAPTTAGLSISLADVSTDPPAPMLLNLLDPEGATVIFGDGGVGKGSLAAWLITRLVTEKGMRVAIFDFENHAREWGSRTEAYGLADKDMVRLSLPTNRDVWKGAHGPIWDIRDDLKSVVDEWGIDFVVVDSVARACGGLDPSDAKAPSLYIDAMDYIGKPSMTIAHVTKALEHTKPYGNAGWHNQPRMTLSYELKGGDHILTHRKANNYNLRELPRWLVSADFNALGLPMNLALTRYDENLWDRIKDFLAYRKGTKFTAEEIADELAKELRDGEAATSAATIKGTLHRHKDVLSSERISPKKTVWWLE